MNVFEDALRKVDSSAKLLGEDASFLHFPEKILMTNFPVKIKGVTNYITGYRIQYNSFLGPTKGGLRFAPGVDIDEVKALALWMTIKNSLAGLPYGGAKGGVTVNTKELSADELQLISRSFARSIARDIGSNIDVPAPDVNTNPDIMGWVLDEVEKVKGYHDPGMITGKPVILGGSLGRDLATAMGAFFVIKSVKSKCSVIVQGFGNVGMNIARLLFDAGYKIVGVSDSSSGVYSVNGLNVNELIKHKESNKNFNNFRMGKIVSNEELLESECDLLIPSAIENVITVANADKIKAKFIVEMANGPVTSEADEILDKKGVILYPDVLCNSGGVIVSYFEWVQNNQGFYWTLNEVNDRLNEKMITNFNAVNAEAKRLNCSFRKAAYTLAIKRLIDAKKARGL